MRWIVALLAVALVAGILGFGGIAEFSLELVLIALIVGIVVAAFSTLWNRARA